MKGFIGDYMSKNVKMLKRSSARKYQCAFCGMSVRATRDVRIMCLDCMCIMDKVFDYSKIASYND